MFILVYTYLNLTLDTIFNGVLFAVIIGVIIIIIVISNQLLSEGVREVEVDAKKNNRSSITTRRYYNYCNMMEKELPVDIINK